MTLVLVVDNYDSFTYNLVQYLGELGAEVEAVRNDVASVDDLLGRGGHGLELLARGDGDLHLGAGAQQDHLRGARRGLGQHVGALPHARRRAARP